MKVGTVALIGRPNTGKSTLVNNLVGQKVAITTPKPQTTQFPIYAVFEDDRGQIVFIDTPGLFAKTKDARIKEVNLQTQKVLREDVDVIAYVIDRSRKRGIEENRVLGLVRKSDKPKILVINKIDKTNPDYSADYKFMEEEFDKVVEVSALKDLHLNALLEDIFSYLKEGEKIVIKEDLPIPALNLTSNQYIGEIIREKAFLTLHDEVPYQIRVVVDEVVERDLPAGRQGNGTIYIKARILTSDIKYKKMIIGDNAHRIKQIGSMARKEFEVATDRKIYLDLTVEEDEV